MELALFIWVASILTPIAAVLTVAGVLLLFVDCVVRVEPSLNKNDATVIKAAKKMLVGGAVCIFTATILPSTNTAWLMAGGYAAQTAVQSEVGRKTLTVIESKVDDAYKQAMKGK